SSRRRHTSFSRDWSSDVCSSDLLLAIINAHLPTELSARARQRLSWAAWVAFPSFVFALFSSSKLVERLFGFYVPLYPTDIDIEIPRSEEHTSELQSRENLVCRLLLEKKKKT